MRISVIFRVMLRRWYLTIFVLVFAAAATVAVVAKVGPTYQAEGAVLILPPQATVDRNAEVLAVGNPLLSLGGVSQARDLVIQQVTSKSTRDRVSDHFPGIQYEVNPDFTNSAPVIIVTVESSSPELATAALDSVIAEIPSSLQDLQAGFKLSPDASISSVPIVVDTVPEVLHKDQIRSAVLVAVVASGFGLLVVGLFDGLVQARKKRRAKREGSPSGAVQGSGDISDSGPATPSPTSEFETTALPAKKVLHESLASNAPTTDGQLEARDRPASRLEHSVADNDPHLSGPPTSEQLEPQWNG